jgi:hypothetical protein
VQASRAVREYLEGLNADGRPETLRKSISVTDPAAEWIQEVDATRTMIDRVEDRFAIKPTRLIGDMAYGTAELLAWMVNDKAIDPHVPLWDKTQRTDDTLSSGDFQWDEQRNEYRCPQSLVLRSEWRPFKNARTHITKVDTIIYRSRQSDCANCPMKSRCCPHTPIRKIRRSIHEPARDVARAVAKTRLYKQSRKDRKKVEMLFAHLKRMIPCSDMRGARCEEYCVAGVGHGALVTEGTRRFSGDRITLVANIKPVDEHSERIKKRRRGWRRVYSAEF